MDPNNPYAQPQQPQQPQQPAGFPPVQQPQQYQQPPQPQQPQPQPYGPLTQPQPGSVASQYPVDYLNQISTQQNVKKVSPRILFAAIAGVILLAGVVMFFLIRGAAPPSAATQLVGLQARIQTLNKVVTEQRKHLTQNELTSINGTAGAMLTSMDANVTAYMKTRGIKSSQSAGGIKTAENKYYDTLSKKLNDAYLTGTLDRTYSAEMTYQFSLLKSKMQAAKAASKSKTYNEFYEANITSLDTVTEQLGKFQSTK